ncbi:DUF6355 family natural product biosynthesis protein [Amycolatopsis sp. NPDC004378]
MSTPLRRTLWGAAGVTASALALALLPGVASAAAANTAAANAPCGYVGYEGSNGQQPLYNHCGNGDVVVQVDHFFWQTTYACVAPGVHELPQGDSQWRIIGAEYDGHTCSFPGPVEGP